MSLYADYVQERLEQECIETDDGFITFAMLEPGACLIEDLYVVPEKRRARIAWDFADRVCVWARARRCHTLVARVYVGSTNATEALKAQLAYGFKLHHLEQDRIVLTKSLKE